MDIVHRLRHLAQNDYMVDQYFTETGRLLNEAANEILKLRARRDGSDAASIYDARLTVEKDKKA